jgi:hypothetical protein
MPENVEQGGGIVSKTKHLQGLTEMRLRLIKATAILAGLAGLLGVQNIVRADPIGPDCTNDSCFGVVYTLQSFLVDDANHIFNFILFADTSGYDGGGDAIEAAAFKVTSQSNLIDYDSVTLIGAPAPLGDWDIHFGGVNANGCQDNTDGFICSENTTTPPTVPDGLLQWIWQVDYVNAPTLIDPASIKLLYTLDGQQHGLTSENIHLQSCDLPEGCTPKKIPEPGTLALLGALGIGVGFLRRRKSA